VQVGLPEVQTGVEKVPALREAAWDEHERFEVDAAQELEVVGVVVVVAQSGRLLVAGVVALELEEPTLEGEEVELRAAPSWFWVHFVSHEQQLRF
jgi:hypothetical protein